MYGNNKPLHGNKNMENMLKNISVNNAEGENIVINKNNTKIKNLIQNAEKSANKHKINLPEVSSPNVFGFGGILLLTAGLIIVMTIIYFRDYIVKYFVQVKNEIVYNIGQTSSPYKSLEEKYNDLMNQMLQNTAVLESTSQNNLINQKENSEKEQVINEKNQLLENKQIEIDEIKRRNQEEIEELNKTLSQKDEENSRKESQIKQSAIGEIKGKLNTMCKFKKNTRVTKNGFCYIGYDLGQRECTDVYEGDICMSGKIFPTMAQCQNPKLR